MSKSNELKSLYERIELNYTDEMVLLAKVKSGGASNDEINELIDIVQANSKGAKVLDEIKKFEKKLISDVNEQLVALEEMENEYNDVAHIEDESVQNQRYADMKVRYKRYVSKAEELNDAIKIAYFQIANFKQYEDRLYDAKEPLSFLE